METPFEFHNYQLLRMLLLMNLDVHNLSTLFSSLFHQFLTFILFVLLHVFLNFCLYASGTL